MPYLGVLVTVNSLIQDLLLFELIIDVRTEFNLNPNKI